MQKRATPLADEELSSSLLDLLQQASALKQVIYLTRLKKEQTKPRKHSTEA
jgi:hypothetical protein